MSDPTKPLEKAELSTEMGSLAIISFERFYINLNPDEPHSALIQFMASINDLLRYFMFEGRIDVRHFGGTPKFYYLDSGMLVDLVEPFERFKCYDD